MTCYLDTNICIYALNGTYPAIESNVREVGPDQIHIPSIVRAELLLGAAKSNRKEETLETVEKFLFPYEIVPFDSEGAEAYAEIRGRLENRGQPIGPNDLIIAATVASRGGVLITRNTDEFDRIEVLETRDWTEPVQ